ncbi:hypothetical protein SNEBB_008859 [Seison nebaliae]|nr:hypothetical protein SNEBB_008859 [Seison nebaliae]
MGQSHWTVFLLWLYSSSVIGSNIFDVDEDYGSSASDEERECMLKCVYLNVKTEKDIETTLLGCQDECGNNKLSKKFIVSPPPKLLSKENPNCHMQCWMNNLNVVDKPGNLLHYCREKCYTSTAAGAKRYKSDMEFDMPKNSRPFVLTPMLHCELLCRNRIELSQVGRYRNLLSPEEIIQVCNNKCWEKRFDKRASYKNAPFTVSPEMKCEIKCVYHKRQQGLSIRKATKACKNECTDTVLLNKRGKKSKKCKKTCIKAEMKEGKSKKDAKKKCASKCGKKKGKNSFSKFCSRRCLKQRQGVDKLSKSTCRSLCNEIIKTLKTSKPALKKFKKCLKKYAQKSDNEFDKCADKIAVTKRSVKPIYSKSFKCQILCVFGNKKSGKTTKLAAEKCAKECSPDVNKRQVSDNNDMICETQCTYVPSTNQYEASSVRSCEKVCVQKKANENVPLVDVCVKNCNKVLRNSRSSQADVDTFCENKCQASRAAYITTKRKSKLLPYLPKDYLGTNFPPLHYWNTLECEIKCSLAFRQRGMNEHDVVPLCENVCRDRLKSLFWPNNKPIAHNFRIYYKQFQTFVSHDESLTIDMIQLIRDPITEIIIDILPYHVPHNNEAYLLNMNVCLSLNGICRSTIGKFNERHLIERSCYQDYNYYMEKIFQIFRFEYLKLNQCNLSTDDTLMKKRQIARQFSSSREYVNKLKLDYMMEPNKFTSEHIFLTNRTKILAPRLQCTDSYKLRKIYDCCYDDLCNSSQKHHKIFGLISITLVSYFCEKFL